MPNSKNTVKITTKDGVSFECSETIAKRMIRDLSANAKSVPERPVIDWADIDTKQKAIVKATGGADSVEFVMNVVGSMPEHGFHVVWTGLNSRLRKDFNEPNPRALTERLKKEGLIVIHPWKDGVKIQLA
jgi:hypothetical protein